MHVVIAAGVRYKAGEFPLYRHVRVAEMKLDMDLLRALLLHVEEKATQPHSNLENIEVTGWTGEEVAYHVALAHEAGLLKASIDELPDAEDESAIYIAYSVHRLTMEGHEMLETVRTDRAWAAVKHGALKAGSFTVSAVADVAKAYLKSEISRVLGIAPA